MTEQNTKPIQLVTFGKSITNPEALETMPAVNLMAMLQSGQWRKPIEAIRKEKNPILQKEMKLRLPYFVYGVLEGARNEENVLQVNGIVFDFDHVGADFEEAKRRLMDAAPWFRWLFRSPVDGLKLMLPFSRPVTDRAEYLKIWKLLKEEIEAKSGMKADNTPDLCRACFLSWDDDVIVSPEEYLMDLDEYLAGVEKKRKGEKVGGSDQLGVQSATPISTLNPDPAALWTSNDNPVKHRQTVEVQAGQASSATNEEQTAGLNSNLAAGLNSNLSGDKSTLAASHSGTERPRRAETESSLSASQTQACHSGVGAPESNPSNQTRFTEKSGSIQTASASTPSEGITPTGWIPGPHLHPTDSLRFPAGTPIPRDDAAAEPSGQSDTTPPHQNPSPNVISANHNDPRHPRSISPTPIRDNSCNSWTDKGSTTPDEAQAKSAVEYLALRKLDRHDWIRCGIALYNHFGEDGIIYWLQFAYNPNYDDTPEDLQKVWKRLKKYPGVGLGTLFYIAEQYGWVNAIGQEQKGKGEKVGVGVGSDDPTCQSGEGAPESTSIQQIRENSCNSWTDKTLADFPELLELFRRPQNVPLDRAKLPDEFNAYLDLVGRVTDAQDGAKLTAFLPVVAANIGNRVYMYNAGTRHYCNVWAAIIGPSTVSRKTTVINQAMKMIAPFKETLTELSAKERNEQDIELSRVTQARLYNLLAINPNRLILQMELSAWMREMGKSYNAGMKQEITDMFDGKDRSIAKMEIDEHISRPAFSIVGATTEDWFFQELREVADQRGGFLQRFIICIIQNIDVNDLRLASVDSSDCDRDLAAWDEMLSVFRELPGSHRLHASDEARDFRDAIYAELMKAIAINANDPQAAYCARIFDNYFWRFCILIFLLKNWRDLREAVQNERTASWFGRNQVDKTTAEQAWYLCEYYYRNTRPFLKQLTEGSKLDEERKILRYLQAADDQKMTHSRLLNKSKLSAREFRSCIESLLERQAILCHEEVRYRNKVGLMYSLNPVLEAIEIH